jgi:hypothetical protein
MPLDVGGDVLEIVQRVCDRALNVATASAKSSTHGAKAGMRALRGRTVKHLPDGEGVVKDRALKLADLAIVLALSRRISETERIHCSSPPRAPPRDRP